MSVGLVIVSHSAQLAVGVAELAGQMTQGKVRLVAAGGTVDGSLGTSVDRITMAVQQADSGEGVVLLFDLGSALMAAELALEALPADLRARVEISGAPLVEGAVVAAIEAAVGGTVSSVLQAAQGASTTPKAPMLGASNGSTPSAMAGVSASTQVLLINKVGLHARPASLFVQTATRFTAQITVALGDRLVDGKRILAILQLGARCGDTLHLSATGPDAHAALDALAALVQRKFGEE